MREENLTIWRSKIKNIISTLSWTLLVLLIAIALFLVYVGVSTKFYSRNVNGKKPMFTLYTIISPSMEPNIKVYDTIVNKKVDINRIEVGDVITFISTSNQSRGLTVTHRVKNINKNDDGTIAFQTQGDNNLSPDTATVDGEHFIGKVIFKVPQLGRIQFLLSSRNSWLLLIMLPSLYLLVKYIIKLVKILKMEESVEKTVKKYNRRDDYKVDFTKKK